MNQKPKGTKDIFGYKQNLRKYVFEKLDDISNVFNYKQIETPIFEKEDVFVKSVGESSDIVSKEMYTFDDKSGRKMTLRPEGTAGTIRAIVENKLYTKTPLKLYYVGPMFRYENPQKGRQRQFTQYGVEVLSDKSPLIDAEVILTASTILDTFGIPYELQINSLGNSIIRGLWADKLKKYFLENKDMLSKDSIRRIESNPMRILDDKIDGQKDVVKNAPKISEFYDEETKEYFNQLTSFLETLQIKFTINENLVRGLDYYTDTAFEFVSKADMVGAQSTIIGGGRYESLVKESGGPDISGIGFGIGIERLVNDLEKNIDQESIEINPDVFVLNIDEAATSAALGITYMLRRAGIATEWNYKPTKLQKAFIKADKAKAKVQIIAGSRELINEEVVVKHGKNQENVKINKLAERVINLLGEIHEND